MKWDTPYNHSDWFVFCCMTLSAPPHTQTFPLKASHPFQSFSLLSGRRRGCISVSDSSSSFKGAVCNFSVYILSLLLLILIKSLLFTFSWLRNKISLIVYIDVCVYWTSPENTNGSFKILIFTSQTDSCVIYSFTAGSSIPRTRADANKPHAFSLLTECNTPVCSLQWEISCQIKVIIRKWKVWVRRTACFRGLDPCACCCRSTSLYLNLDSTSLKMLRNWWAWYSLKTRAGRKRMEFPPQPPRRTPEERNVVWGECVRVPQRELLQKSSLERIFYIFIIIISYIILN